MNEDKKVIVNQEENEETTNLDIVLDLIFGAFHSFFQWVGINFMMAMNVFVGALYIATVNFHVRAIIPLSSQISGFYLFAFTMTTVINVFASLSYNKKRSFFKLLLTTLISCALWGFIFLFIREMLAEIKAGMTDSTINMLLSQIILLFGVLLSFIGIIIEWVKRILNNYKRIKRNERN